MKELKIALQMFGHLRTYEICFPYLKKHLLDFGDFDIFIHTWDELERRTDSHFKSSIASKEINKDFKNEVIDTYKPCQIEFSPQQNFYPVDQVDGVKTRSMNGLRNMFYSISRSCELRNSYEIENNKHYDFVIVIRPDILLRSPFPIDKIIHKLKQNHYKNSLYSAPYIKEYVFLKESNVLDSFTRATDVFFMGKPEVVNQLKGVSATDNFYDVNDNEEKTRLWGESQFSNYLAQNGISQKYLTYVGGKDWRIQRHDDVALTNEKTDFKRNFRVTRKYLYQSIKSIFNKNV